MLITRLCDGNAGLYTAGSEDDTTQKLFFTHTLSSIWPRRRGAGEGERWPSLSLLLCLRRFEIFLVPTVYMKKIGQQSEY